MDIALGSLVAALLLLPGFLVVKARQAAREHARQDNFEATIVSLAFSVVIFGLWTAANAIYERLSPGTYSFTVRFMAWFSGGGPSNLLVPDSFVAILSYFTTAAMVILAAFAWTWIGGPQKAKQGLRLYKFTEHLTPWEDFVQGYRDRWVAARLTDGRTIVGRMGIASHSPFPREIILTSTPDQAVDSYDENHRKENHSLPLDAVYLSADTIRTIEAFADPTTGAAHRVPIAPLLPLTYLATFIASHLGVYSMASVIVGLEPVSLYPFILLLLALVGVRCVFKWIE